MPEGLIDPRVMKKGVEELREQMKEMEREAFLIEENVERMH